MPLLKGNTRSVIGANIKELKRSGRTKDQAIAISLSKAGKVVHKDRNPAKPVKGPFKYRKPRLG